MGNARDNDVITSRNNATRKINGQDQQRMDCYAVTNRCVVPWAMVLKFSGMGPGVVYFHYEAENFSTLPVLKYIVFFTVYNVFKLT